MKKIITVILLITTLLTIAACAAEESGNNSESVTGAKPDETTAAVQEYKSPGVNYNNAVITIGAADHTKDNYAIVWSVENYCDAYASEQNGDPINDALYLRNQRVEDELGVIINAYNLGTFVTNGDNLQKLIMSADNAVDIAFMSGNHISKFMGTDMVLDLKSIPNVDFSHSWWDQKSVKEYDLFGTMAIVTGDINLNSNFAQVVYFFNKQLADDFKLENIYDIVRNGSWTYPKMMEMCRTVAHDINGDGIIDVDDCFGLMAEGASVVMAVISGGVRLTTKDSEGVPQITANTQRTVDLVQMIIPFMMDKETNILATNYVSRFKSPFADLMVPTFIDNRALFFSNQLLIGMEFRRMDGDFGILPSPKYDAAQDNYYNILSNYWATYIMIPTTSSKTDMAGHVLDAMGYYSQQYVTPAYIDTTVMNKTLRDEDSAEMMHIIFGSRYFDLATVYNWGGIYGMFGSMIGANNTNFASEFAKIETRIQAEIDKTVEMLR